MTLVADWDVDINPKLSRLTFITVLALNTALCGSAFAQEAAGTPADTAMPAAMLNNGWGEATLADAVRDGDKLRLTVRFKAAEGAANGETVYSGLTEQSWENDFYLTAGEKKYLILKDANGTPLAPNALRLDPKALQAGAWTATFPAPPAGEQATLFMLGVEPLGPFSVPQ